MDDGPLYHRTSCLGEQLFVGSDPPALHAHCSHHCSIPPHRWSGAERGRAVGQRSPAPISHLPSHSNSPSPWEDSSSGHGSVFGSAIATAALPQHLRDGNQDAPPSTETQPFRSKCIPEQFLHEDVPSFPSVRITVLNTTCTFQTLASPEKIARANYKKKNKPPKKKKQMKMSNK